MNFVLAFLCSLIFSLTSCLAAEKPAEKLDPKAQEVLDYWFGTLNDPDDFPKGKIILWFGKKDELDRDIRNKYEYLVQAAANHELDEWKSTAHGRLALIILLDQFPRNMYRGTGQAFAFDNQALQLTLEALDKQEDQQLFPVERIFLYFPLTHSENKDLQKLAVEKYRSLVPATTHSLRSHYKSYLDFSLRHYDVIQTFGRFPQRNKVLNRESTAEELEFLKTSGNAF